MFERFDDAFLAEHLLPARDFAPYPPYEDRAAWAASVLFMRKMAISSAPEEREP